MRCDTADVAFAPPLPPASFALPLPPAFAGADAPQVLAALGYSPGEVLGLKQSRACVPTNWYAWADEPPREPLSSPVPPSDELLKEGLE